jgi:hypothetical protein
MQIQRVARGFVGRRRALHRWEWLQHRKAEVFVEQLIRQGVRKEVARVAALRLRMATLIQRVYRGHLTRLVLGRVRKVARRQGLAAACIQVSRVHTSIFRQTEC